MTLTLSLAALHTDSQSVGMPQVHFHKNIGSISLLFKKNIYLCNIVRNQDEETNNLLNQHKSKVMKTRNDFNKYGLITMIGWNILLIVLILIVSTIKGFPFTYIIDDDTGGIGMTVFLLLWSLIWYGIGYKSRKDYVIARNMYREQVPLLEYERFNKAYRDYYIGKQARLLSIVFATAIPWYVIGYVSFPITNKDIIIIAIMVVISVLCFCISKYKTHA